MRRGHEGGIRVEWDDRVTSRVHSVLAFKMFGGPQRVLALTTGAYAATISTTPLQTVNGFGASGAWWVKDLALFPAEVRQNVSELLLNQTSGAPNFPSVILDSNEVFVRCQIGLGLTDYRYNLGGGGVGVGDAFRSSSRSQTGLGSLGARLGPSV